MDPRDLSDHVSYQSGGGIEEIAHETDCTKNDIINLSSNENVLGPPPKSKDILRKHVDQASNYPKAVQKSLSNRLAVHWNVDPNQVWLGNGMNGAIDCLSRAILRPEDTALVPQPGFSYYGMSVRFHHASVRKYLLSNDDYRLQNSSTMIDSYEGDRIIFVNTPHNPTGSEMELSSIKRIANETDEQTLVVVDEAYAEFSDRESAVQLLNDHDDIAVLRTFSKAYGLAGLRIGYALVPAEWAEVYSKIHTPFDSGELACRAALAALEDENHIKQTLDMVRNARSMLYNHLKARTWKSGGNFVLAETVNAKKVANHCKRNGIIIRDCRSFDLPSCIRITCGSPEMMIRTIEFINNLISKN